MCSIACRRSAPLAYARALILRMHTSTASFIIRRMSSRAASRAGAARVCVLAWRMRASRHAIPRAGLACLRIAFLRARACSIACLLPGQNCSGGPTADCDTEARPGALGRAGRSPYPRPPLSRPQAPSPLAPGEIGAPRPCPRASRASPVQTWLRSCQDPGSPFLSRPDPRMGLECLKIACRHLCALQRALLLRAYACRIRAYMLAAPACDAARNDMRRIMNDAMLVCMQN